MTNAFLERVLRERVVDTINYRYRVFERVRPDRKAGFVPALQIKRIPRVWLNTAVALDLNNWKVVAESYDGEIFALVRYSTGIEV